MTKTGMRHAVLIMAVELEEDDDLYCEACGLRLAGADGRSVAWPGIPAGDEIVVCRGCAGRLAAEAGGTK